ncbi:MAG: hypothetical protein U0V04_13375 [Spirosomataceae bacterium]|jgi:hypothetical protein
MYYALEERNMELVSFFSEKEEILQDACKPITAYWVKKATY